MQHDPYQLDTFVSEVFNINYVINTDKIQKL